MAEKQKGKSGDKSTANAKAAEPEEKKADHGEGEAAEAEHHEKAEHHEADGHGDHGHGAHGAKPHEHKPDVREYMIIFAVLAFLTVLEVGVAQIHGLSKVPMSLALVGLALTKAAIVALFYMHLKHETKVLKFTVALPMAAPTIYALVLITEATWRLHR